MWVHILAYCLDSERKILSNNFKMSNSFSRITEKTKNFPVYSPTENSLNCTSPVWTSGKRVRMSMKRVWDWHVVSKLSLLHKQVRNSWRDEHLVVLITGSTERTGCVKMQKCFSAHFLEKFFSSRWLEKKCTYKDTDIDCAFPDLIISSQNKADHFTCPSVMPPECKNVSRHFCLHWKQVQLSYSLKLSPLKQDYKNQYKTKIIKSDILCSRLVSVLGFLLLSFHCSVLCSSCSLTLLIHQVTLLIALQDYPIQHGVWEKTLVMADTLLISFN